MENSSSEKSTVIDLLRYLIYLIYHIIILINGLFLLQIESINPIIPSISTSKYMFYRVISSGSEGFNTDSVIL